MQRLNIAGTLMFQDTPCCEFVIENDYCTKFDILCEDYDLLPFGCNPDEFANYKENLILFFYDRTTPPTRQFIDRDLKKIGMNYYDMSKLIMFQHGMSVQDPFWIRTDEGPQTWKELKDDFINRWEKYR